MAVAKQQTSTTPSKKDFSVAKKCTCRQEFQDSEHGLSMRVMNSCRDGTVCNSTTKV